MAVLVILLVLHSLNSVSGYRVHQIGGASHWSASTVNYADWSASQTFLVGDIIQFKFSSFYDVVNVGLTEYGDCTYSDVVQTSSPVNYTLHKAQTYYFICTKYCKEYAMKVAVTAVESAPSPPRRISFQAISSPPSPYARSSLDVSPSYDNSISFPPISSPYRRSSLDASSSPISSPSPSLAPSPSIPPPPPSYDPPSYDNPTSSSTGFPLYLKVIIPIIVFLVLVFCAVGLIWWKKGRKSPLSDAAPPSTTDAARPSPSKSPTHGDVFKNSGEGSQIANSGLEPSRG